jgi:hypothetical protein
VTAPVRDLLATVVVGDHPAANAANAAASARSSLRALFRPTSTEQTSAIRGAINAKYAAAYKRLVTSTPFLAVLQTQGEVEALATKFGQVYSGVPWRDLYEAAQLRRAFETQVSLIAELEAVATAYFTRKWPAVFKTFNPRPVGRGGPLIVDPARDGPRLMVMAATWDRLDDEERMRWLTDATTTADMAALSVLLPLAEATNDVDADFSARWADVLSAADLALETEQTLAGRLAQTLKRGMDGVLETNVEALARNGSWEPELAGVSRWAGFVPPEDGSRLWTVPTSGTLPTLRLNAEGTGFTVDDAEAAGPKPLAVGSVVQA